MDYLIMQLNLPLSSNTQQKKTIHIVLYDTYRHLYECTVLFWVKLNNKYTTSNYKFTPA